MLRWSEFQLFPEQASGLAGRVDALFFFMVGISVLFTTLIVTLVAVFAVRYRRRARGDVGAPIHGSWRLELVWTVVPLAISMVMFVWGAVVFIAQSRPPRGALEITVVGKQWMWKVQHENGRREINELHVPAGRPVRLTMGTEDVIHSFFIPAFRVKADVVPGRMTTMWFDPQRPGTYRIFCAEYCGAKHSGMIGWVTVLEPAEFQKWLDGGASETSMASMGQKLFEDFACVTCHRPDAGGRGPVLEGLFGKTVALRGGRSIVADENYLRESIVNPMARVVEGFEPLMPTYQGLISEEGLLQLIAYIRSLTPEEPDPGAAPPAGPGGGTVPGSGTGGPEA